MLQNTRIQGPALVGLAALLGLAVTPGEAKAADQPNIIFIMGDDIGMWNISQ